MVLSQEARDRVAGAEELHVTVRQLRAKVAAEGARILESWRPRIRRESFLPSASNLASYIALRHHDLRELQLELMPWGLSSLGRCEARVLESLDALEATLAQLARPDVSPERGRPVTADYYRGQALLQEHTAAALGPLPPGRDVRIMVTMPTAAAADYGLVRELVERGMNVARVNCAHDSAHMWTAMAEHVRRAAAELGRPCRVCMDLCGPRSRTGAVVAEEDTRVEVGDSILLTVDPAGDVGRARVRVGCSLPEALEQIEVGHSVWVDEGKLGAIVERKLDGPAGLLRVTDAPAKGVRLRPDKGLNFPDTELSINSLTDQDLDALDVVAGEADIIGYSFVQRASDVARLQDELAARVEDPDRVALVAKIETAAGIHNLPEVIVQAAGAQPLAVMIARGDLAVEIGHRRLAEMQEELLWLCEAAHVPVIWATQVLDTFVKKGLRSRAEITDAAMAERAECVMLNKGKFAADAVAFLDDVLSRMEGHQYKKASRMRALHSW
jgi:pyruvate kinase